jgi:hypothetical protein
VLSAWQAVTKKPDKHKAWARSTEHKAWAQSTKQRQKNWALVRAGWADDRSKQRASWPGWPFYWGFRGCKTRKKPITEQFGPVFDDFWNFLAFFQYFGFLMRLKSSPIRPISGLKKQALIFTPVMFHKFQFLLPGILMVPRGASDIAPRGLTIIREHTLHFIKHLMSVVSASQVSCIGLQFRVFNDLIDDFTKSDFKSFLEDFEIFKITLKYGDLIWDLIFKMSMKIKSQII